MCLAVPVRVIEKLAGDAAVVDLGGIRKEISLALVDDVAAGDYVILHVGYALARLDPEEAERTLRLFAEAGLSLPPVQGAARGGDGVEGGV
jgi:hydrogenase expression/formation protein HypC